MRASSFADAADLNAFHHCKAEGYSDLRCFGVGDNGIGKWGDDCSAGSGAKCALPPEDWVAKYGPGDGARHAPVDVTFRGVTVRCLLDDTMPHRANIQNGAGIDLNPDACDLLGLTAPVMANVTWQWEG